MKSKIVILVKLLFIGVILVFFYKLEMADKINSNSIENSHIIYNQKFDKEDSILFNSETLSKMKSKFILESNNRSSLKSFDYDSIGILYYTKIDFANDLQLDQWLMFQEESTTTSTMHSYQKLNGNRNEFYMLGEEMPIINKIIISLTGDNDQMHRITYNKNFVSYYLPVHTFSLRYGEELPIDIFFGGKEISANIRVAYPLMFSFYKVQKSLYLFILIPTDPVMNLQNDLFGRIMNVPKQL